MNILTRQMYMGGECAHHEYYSQFVNPAVLNLVESRIGLTRIKGSIDSSFNDIPIDSWRRLNCMELIDSDLFKEAEGQKYPKGQMGWSDCSNVCILKAAALILKNS